MDIDTKIYSLRDIMSKFKSYADNFTLEEVDAELSCISRITGLTKNELLAVNHEIKWEDCV